MNLPESHLTDQAGRPVDLVRDLIGNRVAAIQFIFTRCTTTCPILGNQFGRVRTLLGDQMAKDFALISITVDPEYDRPDALKDWGRRYGAGPGWSLVTAARPEMDQLLKKLGTSSADRQNHQSQVLVVDGTTSQGLRTSGLASAAELVDVLRRVRAARPANQTVVSGSDANPIARACRARRELIRPSAILHQYAARRSIGQLAPILRRLAPREGGRDQRLLLPVQWQLRRDGQHAGQASRTARRAAGARRAADLDHRRFAERHTGVLAAYARRYNARKGWYFLSGAKGDVDTVLKKLGQYVEVRENHGALLLVGNMRTGLWKKIFGLADTEQVIEQIQAVIDDKAG